MFNRSRRPLRNLPSLSSFLPKRFRTPIQPALPRPASLRPEEHLSVPIMDPTQEEVIGAEAQNRGQFLARQDRWEDLSKELRTADKARSTTPSGMPIAELLAFGARIDVVSAVEHALADRVPAENGPIADGILGFEEVFAEFRNDPAIALIMAQTHIDIAWAWRGTGWDTIVPQLNRERCAAHFDRAKQILEPFCGIELDSPALAATRCALLAGRRNPKTRVADDYEDLIDLAPHNHRHMRALGNHLLPRWFGSYAELELEARRTAARTQDIWGAGGYTWVCFDAIATDEEACARVDVDFFIDGLHDILKARPQQEMVNLLASYCAVALRNGQGLHEEADLARGQICDAADWLIRDHLTEVHPLIWAHATDGFDNNAPVTSISRFAARGRADALHAISNLFREEINRGHRITFTAQGPQLGPI
jgi:hypothetical protein